MELSFVLRWCLMMSIIDRSAPGGLLYGWIKRLVGNRFPINGEITKDSLTIDVSLSDSKV